MPTEKFEIASGTTLGLREARTWTLVRAICSDNRGWTFEKSDESKIELSHKELDKLFDTGWLVPNVEYLKGADPDRLEKQLGGPSALSVEALAKAYERFRFVCEIEDGIANGLSRRSIIKTIQDRLKVEGVTVPCSSTFTNWHNDYIENDRTIQSLAPKEGSGRWGNRMEDDVYTAMALVIEKRRKEKSAESLSKLYDDLKKSLGEKCPCLTTFRKYYIKNTTPHQRYADCYGKLAADEKYGIYWLRPLPETPLEQAEIDAHFCKVYVRLPSGGVAKPWLTAMMDRCTKMILGCHLTLAAPSNLTLRWCLAHSVLEKDLNEMPVPFEWPSFGVPKLIVCDAASEYKNANAADLEAILKFQFDVKPGRKPNMKGSIEEWFKFTEARAFSKEKGRAIREGEDPYQRNPQKEADKTIEELRDVLLRWIKEYHNRPHSSLHGRRPIDVWNEKFPLLANKRKPSKKSIIELFEIEMNKKIGRHGFSWNNAKYFDFRFWKMKRNGLDYKLHASYVTPEFLFYWDPEDSQWHPAFRTKNLGKGKSSGTAKLLVPEEVTFQTAEEMLKKEANLLATGFFTPLPIAKKPPSKSSSAAKNIAGRTAVQNATPALQAGPVPGAKSSKPRTKSSVPTPFNQSAQRARIGVSSAQTSSEELAKRTEVLKRLKMKKL